MKRAMVLFEDEGFVDLLPLVFWRSVFELRVGRHIMLDRAAQRLGMPVRGVWTREWLSKVAAQRCGAPANQPAEDETILVNGRWICDDAVEFPKPPSVGCIGSDIAYIVCDANLAERLSPADLLNPLHREEALRGLDRREVGGRFIRYPWDIIARLPQVLESDWQDGDAFIESKLDKHLALVNPDRIHVGERTIVHPTALIDATGGPVYLSHDVQVGPYAVIEGPAYIGPGSIVRTHSWLHGANAIGPVCKVGGEIDGCVICAYTNKQHAGFWGHAYIGCWVNIGAGATNSDLKNTYGKIRVPLGGTRRETGLQFFGAIVSDHVKLGINASIPTGAVIGLAATISACRLLPQFIPSFSWVTETGVNQGDHLRMLDASCAAMARRHVDMTDEEIELFLDLGTRAKSYESRSR